MDPQNYQKPLAVKLTAEQRAKLNALVKAHPVCSRVSEYVRWLIEREYAAALTAYNARTTPAPAVQPVAVVQNSNPFAPGFVRAPSVRESDD